MILKVAALAAAALGLLAIAAVASSFARDVMRRSSDGDLSRDVAVALGRLPRGRLVDVEGGTDRVSVRLW